jgi:thiamine pyrophosphate-dependent acetolactate synthase large subunit-like protein
MENLCGKTPVALAGFGERDANSFAKVKEFAEKLNLK